MTTLREQTGNGRRAPRFASRGEGKARAIQRTPRVAAIVRAVGDHRFITSHQLAELVALEGYSKDRTRHTLRPLFDDGTLLKLDQRRHFWIEGGGSRPDIYALGDRGAELYADLTSVSPPGRARRHERNRAIKDGLYVEHQLLITAVLVAMARACHARGYLHLVHQRKIALPADLAQERQPFSWRVGLPKPKLVLSCIPDAVFGVRHVGADPPRTAWFFLEADRGTMDVEPADRSRRSKPNLFHKMAAYAESYRQGIHKRRFGFGNVRVLTVTSRTDERLANIRKAAGEAAQGDPAHVLFFSTEGEACSTDILSDVWYSVSGEKRPLVRV